MKYSSKIIIPALIFFISVFTIIALHTVPESQLWKGYKTLYVKSEKLSDENIFSILQKDGCEDVVSRINQKLPVFSRMAPVQVQKKGSYLYERNGFFTDRSKAFSVFYVPDRYSQNLKRAVSEINGYQQTLAATDSGSVFPWICPFVVFIFCGVLFYFSRKRADFILVSIPLLLLALCRPWYTVCAALSLALFADFLLVKIWKREGFFNDLKNGIFIVPLVVLPFIFLIFSSFLSTFLFALSFAGGWALLKLLEEVYSAFTFKNSEVHFDFVYIKNSSAVKTVNGKNVFLFGAVFACVMILFLFASLFAGNSTAFDSEERPYLPGPVSSKMADKNDSLPDFQSFMDWSWQTLSFPFRKISSQNAQKTQLFGESVFIPEYVQNDDGSISVTSTKVLTYNSSFVRSIYDRLDENDYPSLEKLLLSQGKNTTYGYTKNTGTSSERAVSLVLILFAALPLILSLYFIAGNLKNEAYI